MCAASAPWLLLLLWPLQYNIVHDVVLVHAALVQYQDQANVTPRTNYVPIILNVYEHFVFFYIFRPFQDHTKWERAKSCYFSTNVV